ncbi:MAG TPA: hypothetical protein VGK59_15780 [Ohtaekwangia sp.]
MRESSIQKIDAFAEYLTSSQELIAERTFFAYGGRMYYSVEFMEVIWIAH